MVPEVVKRTDHSGKGVSRWLTREGTGCEKKEGTTELDS